MAFACLSQEYSHVQLWSRAFFTQSHSVNVHVQVWIIAKITWVACRPSTEMLQVPTSTHSVTMAKGESERGRREQEEEHVWRGDTEIAVTSAPHVQFMINLIKVRCPATFHVSLWV